MDPASLPPSAPRVQVLDIPLSVDRCLAQVTHAAAGAAVVMVGLVRNHTRHNGQSVTVHRLEYEAYAEMAVGVIAGIVDAIEVATPGVRCAVEHRVGDLVPGDLAVVVVASSPHRQEAFVACQTLIDRLKEDAPIWKREHGDDGVVWVGMGP